MSRFDAVFVGSSPNALAGAARLARAGLRVVVLETRDGVGGPVATEPFAPGFLADTGVMSAAIDPEIAAALGIEVDVIARDRVTALGRKPVTIRDLAALPRAVHDAVALLQAVHRMAPPDVPAPVGADAETLSAIGAHLLGLGPRAMHEVLRLLLMPVRDFGEEIGAPEPVRALLAGAAVRAMSEGPFAQGTLFGLLHHMATLDGLFRATARGGAGALAGALAKAAKDAGVEIRTGLAGPLRVDLAGGAARGVILPDGEVIAADTVVSDRAVRTTFTELVSPRALDPETNRILRAVRYRGSVARVHLGVRGLPSFPGVDEEALSGTLVAATTVAAIERAWDQAKRGSVPEHPYVEIAIPTLRDPSLAPEGHHVIDAWVQYVPTRGADRAAVLRATLAALAPSSPDLAERVIHHHVSLPEDLEARFGLPEGQLYGGEVRLDQAFFLRPFPGNARYETPIERLHLCGSATHPGGYGGRSGWNLAGLLLARGQR